VSSPPPANKSVVTGYSLEKYICANSFRQTLAKIYHLKQFPRFFILFPEKYFLSNPWDCSDGKNILFRAQTFTILYGHY